MSGKLRDVQDLLAREEWDLARSACEALSTSRDGAAISLVWATLGQLYDRGTMPNLPKAIEALTRAVDLEQPQPQPKLLKQLADLQEKHGDFLGAASTLTRIYQTAKSKGNVEKTVELSDVIVSLLKKAKAIDKAEYQRLFETKTKLMEIRGLLHIAANDMATGTINH